MSKKIKQSEYPIVRVEWLDACSWNQEYSIKECTFLLTKCITVGFLIKNDKEKMVIAREIFPDAGTARGSISIAKKDISKINYLK